MKILLQTNNRKMSQLEHEFKKLTESGFEVIPFGYIIDRPVNQEGRILDILEHIYFREKN